MVMPLSLATSHTPSDTQPTAHPQYTAEGPATTRKEPLALRPGSFATQARMTVFFPPSKLRRERYKTSKICCLQAVNLLFASKFNTHPLAYACSISPEETRTMHCYIVSTRSHGVLQRLTSTLTAALSDALSETGGPQEASVACSETDAGEWRVMFLSSRQLYYTTPAHTPNTK